MPPFSGPERRERAARESRDQLATALSIHPRVLASLPPAVVGAIRDSLRSEEKLQRSQNIIQRMRVRMAELQSQASTDSLTGLASRRGLETRLALECAVARRSGTPFTLFLLDADNLKEVNDSHGHEAGDDLLKEVANRLRSSVREVDLAARLGGDEFVLVCPGLDEQGAIELSGRLRDRLSGPCTVEGMSLSVSIGWVVAPADAGPKEVLATADQAMYQAKVGVVRAGRVGSLPGRRVIERALTGGLDMEEEEAAG